MTTENIALFKALGAKMQYLGQRQRLISQNIANADTPGYKPKDLKPVNFGSALKDAQSANKGVIMASTNPAHMGPGSSSQNVKSEKMKKVYEVAPAGNAVVMEEQLVNSGQVQTDYNLMTSLYQKNVRMIKIALGFSG